MKRNALLFLAALTLAGCSLIETKYVDYSKHRLAAKPKDYSVSVYDTQPPQSAPAFTVIGKFKVFAHASDAVTEDELLDQAKTLARQKGADAIINAKTTTTPYSGVDVIPGYTAYRRHRPRSHPPEYVPYRDTLLMLQGELIVFNSDKASAP